MSNRLSQLPVEVLVLSDVPVPARLSQLPVEVLLGPPIPAALAATASISLSTAVSFALPGASFVGVAGLTLSATADLTVPVPPLAVTQLAAELLDLQPNALTVTQLIVETLNPLLRSPIAATQVLTEHLDANPNEARVEALCCELLVIGAPDECLASSETLPIDPE